MQHCVLILSLFHYKHLAAKREKTRFLFSYQVSYLLLCIKTKWCDPLQAAEQKKLFFWHSNIQEKYSLRHCRESCLSEQNAAVIACFSVLSDRILYTDGRRQRRVRGTHVFEPSDRCTHCTCFSGPTPRSSPLPAFTLYSSLRDGGLRWCHEP